MTWWVVLLVMVVVYAQVATFHGLIRLERIFEKEFDSTTKLFESTDKCLRNLNERLRRLEEQ